MKLDIEVLDFGVCLARVDDGSIITCNAAFRKVVQVRAAVEDQKESVFALLGIEFPSKESLPLRETTKTIAGSRYGVDNRWLESHVKIAEVEDGEEVFMVQVKDVTESMQRYEQSTFILETSFDGFWDWNMVTNYEFMSPQFWRMLGHDPATKRHSPEEWQDIIFDEDKARAVEALNKHIATRGEHPYNLPVRYRHMNGSVVTVICKGRVVEWAPDGSPVRMIGTHTDITKLRQKEEREEALRQNVEKQQRRIEQSESALESFISRVQTPVLAISRNVQISEWNPFIEKITGYKEGNVLGRELRELCVEDLPLKFMQLVQNPGPQAGASFQVALRKKDSSIITLLLTSLGVAQANVTSVLFLGQDVSSLLESKAREIEAAANAEKRILEYLAHEIRNPLFASKTACQLIIENLQHSNAMYSREKQMEDMEVVENSLTYVAELLSSVLLIEKLLVGEVEFALRPVNVLRDILKPVADIIRLRSRSIKVFVDCPTDLLIMLDPIRTKQIVVNLGFNSVKFTPRGHIRMGAKILPKDDKEVLQLVMEDTGIGIPEEKKSAVFLKYVSLDQETQGNGIGLYLCRKIVQLMGGEIYLDECYNSGIQDSPGCRFVVNLPFERAEFPATSPAIISDTVTEEYSNVQAVIADDDPINRKLVKRRILKSHSTWVVHEVKNAEECISLVIEDKVPVDVIILDQYMASGNSRATGAEATAQLRELGYKGVIIGFSGNDCEEVFAKAGADGFWRKPSFDFDMILSGLNKRHE